MKTERIGIRITKDLKKKLEVLAQKEHRSLSNYIELILMKYVEEQAQQDVAPKV